MKYPFTNPPGTNEQGMMHTKQPTVNIAFPSWFDKIDPIPWTAIMFLLYFI
jgi:hypothetical protein